MPEDTQSTTPPRAIHMSADQFMVTVVAQLSKLPLGLADALVTAARSSSNKAATFRSLFEREWEPRE